MNILIVDDEKVIRKGVRTLLERSDIPISTLEEAKNGKDACDQLKSCIPDIVITDIRMPIMDGIDLCKVIYNEYPSVETIILSGYEEFTYAKKALQYGVADYILKPITNENLNRVLLRLLTKSSFKWGNNINENEIVAIKSNVSSLIKGVLAENMNEVSSVFNDWKEYCKSQKFSILKVKQLMNAYHFIYKSQIVKHIKSLAYENELSISEYSTIEELFQEYKEYFSQQILAIQMTRIPRSSLIVQEVLKTIHADYRKSILNIKELAENVNISSSYLSKLFRETMNIPITRYISEYRLKQSRKLLETKEELSITEICYAVGFNDYPYYSKYFKRFYGVSPQEYRNMNINN